MTGILPSLGENVVVRLSVIIPVLNEEGTLGDTLRYLQAMREGGHELIVVDGGSRDGTRKEAKPLADGVVLCRAGRAVQMNEGARRAHGNVLLFLHADTLLPKDFCVSIAAALKNPKKVWGRFDVRLSGRHPLLRVVERLINWRSCLTGIATGDQAIFVKRDVYESIGGYPEIPLMEDIAISKLLRRISRPVCLHTIAITSSRRWESHGIMRTILLMWWLRLAFFFGADPAGLAATYRRSGERL